MTFSESIKRCMGSKFSSMTGRAPLSEFWWFILYYWIGFIAIGLLGFGISSAFKKSDNIALIVIILWWLVHFIPYICVLVRRLHDGNKSGAHFFWCCLPYIGPVILLIQLLEGSDPGCNKYGSPYPFTDKDCRLGYNGMGYNEMMQLKERINRAWNEKYSVPDPSYYLPYIPFQQMEFLKEWEQESKRQPVQGNSPVYETTLLNATHQDTTVSYPKENGVCPQCGAPLQEDNRGYCRNCGKFLNT